MINARYVSLFMLHNRCQSPGAALPKQLLSFYTQIKGLRQLQLRMWLKGVLDQAVPANCLMNHFMRKESTISEELISNCDMNKIQIQSMMELLMTRLTMETCFHN